MHHEIIILNETESGQFFKCACCDKYNLSYKNIFMHFSTRELKQFLKILSSLKDEHFNQYHPEGYKAVISKNKKSVGLGFTKEEVKAVIQLIEQSLVLEEAQLMINS
jgi:hypothetical protein